MQRVITFLLILTFSGMWTACKRVDDEPIYPASPISRLYVSFSDVETSDTGPLENIVVFDPADSAGYLPVPKGYATDPNWGEGVTFDPYIGQAFQVSNRDSTVRIFGVSEVGNLTLSRTFKDTISLPSARAIRYNRASDHLFITNDAPINPAVPSINSYYNPARLVGQQKPRKRFNLSERPWALAMGMNLEGDNGTDSLLLVSMLGATHQIRAYHIRDLITGDSVTNNGTAAYTLSIQVANDLRGIAYSSRLDMLLVSDLGSGQISATNPDNSVDGKIYVIENALATLQAGGTITPSRIISGSATRLIDPIDVAIADLPNRNQFIYVADRSRNIYRFSIDATGNVAPEAQASTGQVTPEFIYLDARGGANTTLPEN